jgi:hypothetical protein
VVEVLLAPGGVDAGCLKMPERVGTDPNVLPGRRDRQLAETLGDVLVLDPAPLLVEVREPPPAAQPSQAGT